MEEAGTLRERMSGHPHLPAGHPGSRYRHPIRT